MRSQEVVEAKTSKPGKLGGMMKLTGGGAPKDSHDAKVDYKLFAVTAPESTRVSGSAKASSGGVGIGSVLRVASFADPSEAEMRQTFSEALTNVAKAAMEQLTRKK